VPDGRQRGDQQRVGDDAFQQRAQWEEQVIVAGLAAEWL
jgi:hypothetical protein